MRKWLISLMILTLALSTAGTVSAMALTGGGGTTSPKGDRGVPDASGVCAEDTPDCIDTIVIGDDNEGVPGTRRGRERRAASAQYGWSQWASPCDLGQGVTVTPDSQYQCHDLPDGSYASSQVEPSDQEPSLVPGFPTVEVLAPIDSVGVLLTRSFPRHYMLVVLSGLSNSCVTFNEYKMVRDRDLIKVKVTNLEPADKDTICDEDYRTVDHNITLGSDFESGKTYTVLGNNVAETFVAQ